ncbi:MAG: ComF family protein, partial [Solirubrobacterales bacterium]
MHTARPGRAPLPDLDRLVWAAPYEGMPRGLVSALKFGGRLALADVAAEAIARSLGELGEERAGMRSEARPPPDAIVPVPPAFLRRRLRGFDPAEL